MGLFRRIAGAVRRTVDITRRVGGFLLGPRRVPGDATSSRQAVAAYAQAEGDEAAPWWFAPVRKLWAALLGIGIAWAQTRFGWDLTGFENEIEQAGWMAFAGWLVWRAGNRT